MAAVATQEVALPEKVVHEGERRGRQADPEQTSDTRRRAETPVTHRVDPCQGGEEREEPDAETCAPLSAEDPGVDLEARHEHQPEHAEMGEEHEPLHARDVQRDAEQQPRHHLGDRGGNTQLETHHARDNQHGGHEERGVHLVVRGRFSGVPPAASAPAASAVSFWAQGRAAHRWQLPGRPP